MHEIAVTATTATDSPARVFARTLLDALTAAGWLPDPAGRPRVRCPLTGLEARPLGARSAGLIDGRRPGLAPLFSREECPQRAALDVAAQVIARKRGWIEDAQRREGVRED